LSFADKLVLFIILLGISAGIAVAPAFVLSVGWNLLAWKTGVPETRFTWTLLAVLPVVFVWFTWEITKE
jgi:hypothetical protein